MEDMLSRAWEDLFGRIGGPMTFRVILQPVIAVLLAVRAGLRDARRGAPPYVWTVFTDAERRGALLRDGWKDVARVFVLAIVMDVIYQVIVLRWIYPGETLIVALALAVVPYALLRGPVTRIAAGLRRRP